MAEPAGGLAGGWRSTLVVPARRKHGRQDRKQTGHKGSGFMIIDGARAADRTSALVLRFCAAYSRGDADGLLDCLAEDVVHDVNQGDREMGKAAFRAYITQHMRSYREEWRDVVVMSIDDGTRAAAEFSVHGVYQNAAPGLPAAQGQRYVLT
jgi:steroid delta-isomerase-like uncharacterized protein